MAAGEDIPAPTGEPPAAGRRSFHGTGHPRTYGGTNMTQKYTTAARGTSPHLRGNLAGHQAQPLPARDIPAPTGEPLPVPGVRPA